MSGSKLALLYGIAPHLLGFCGPRNEKATSLVIQYLNGEEALESKVRKILRDFEGAYPYYKLIAKSNNIKNPLDWRVVRAYWVGNELLEKVTTANLKKMIIEEFSKPGLLSKKAAIEKSHSVPEGVFPHHSFHVLIIGAVTGRIVLEGKLLDLCRVGWGRVKKCKTQSAKCKIIVEYKPLVGKKKLRLGKMVEKEINWDKSLLPEVKIGDWVSFHWGQAVEILSKEDIGNLKYYTKNTLKG